MRKLIASTLIHGSVILSAAALVAWALWGKPGREWGTMAIIASAVALTVGVATAFAGRAR